MDKIDKIDALFVAKSTSVPGLGGGGGLSQSWQCQDFGRSGCCNPSLTSFASLFPEAQFANTVILFQGDIHWKKEPIHFFSPI